MMSHRLTFGSLSQAVFWFAGFAATLFCGPGAWSQEAAVSSGKETKAEAAAGRNGTSPAEDSVRDRAAAARPSLAEQKAARQWLEQVGRARRRSSLRHPAHELMLVEAREEVEVLEAQIEAKKAHIALVDARLKQAKGKRDVLNRQAAKGPDGDARKTEIEGEVAVLEAECDAERAEIKEPRILLKHAKRRLEDLEAGDSGTAAMPTGHAQSMGADPLIGARPMTMHHFGMHPMEIHAMNASRMLDVDEKLLQIRDAIENLEYEIDRLAGKIQK